MAQLSGKGDGAVAFRKRGSCRGTRSTAIARISAACAEVISSAHSGSARSTTIDSARFKLFPGVRILKAELNLSMRSSVGGVHSVSLPQKADVQKLLVNGDASPIRREGRKLRIHSFGEDGLVGTDDDVVYPDK